MPGRQLPRVGAAVTVTVAVIVMVVAPASGRAAAAPDEHSGYRVRAGDTLSAVALRLGVDSARLAAANGLADPDQIFVGELLKAPSPVAAARHSAAASATYKVRPGDTLSQVAPRLGVSEAQLAAANSLTNPNSITAGRTLVVPPSPAAATAPASSPGTAASTAASSATSVAVSASWQCPAPGAHFVDDYGYLKLDGERHQGVDLYAPRFAPVIAPVAGVVTPYPNHLGGLAFQLAGIDGNRYYGAHLQAFGHTGAVSAGTVIGFVGDSGDALGGPTHLHFEIHPGGGPAADPYKALAGSCR